MKVATFVAEHPCAPKVDIAPDAESEKQLTWLASTGHVVAFTNGVFSAVEKFPKYGPQWQKWKKAKPAVEKPAGDAPTVEPTQENASAEPAATSACEEDVKVEGSAVAATETLEEKKEETIKDEASTQLAE